MAELGGMRWAIISDIHANIEALSVAMSIIDTMKVDRVICLGDVVGYGPDPDACVDLIRDRSDVILMGNHDHAVANPEATKHFNPLAREAVMWTREKLRDENLAFLESLPFSHFENDLFFVHATPYKPEEWHYIFSWNEALPQFDYFDQSVCFIGHSHLPQMYYNNTLVAPSLQLDHRARYIINVGSVGQPRDGDPRLSFGVFDDSIRQYFPVRAQYDVEKTAQKVIAVGLPPFLADRLIKGR